MANQDHFRKLFIRSALVTSSTIATLVGAQTLMLSDAGRYNTGAATEVASPATPSNLVTSNTTSMAQDSNSESGITIHHAAPNIVVLGQANTGSSTSQISNNQAIQPPNPVQIAPPAPVIVQQSSVPLVVQQQSAPSTSRTRPSK